MCPGIGRRRRYGIFVNVHYYFPVFSENNDYGHTRAFWALNEQLPQLERKWTDLFFVFRTDPGIGK